MELANTTISTLHLAEQVKEEFSSLNDIYKTGLISFLKDPTGSNGFPDIATAHLRELKNLLRDKMTSDISPLADSNNGDLPVSLERAEKLVSYFHQLRDKIKKFRVMIDSDPYKTGTKKINFSKQTKPNEYTDLVKTTITDREITPKNQIKQLHIITYDFFPHSMNNIASKGLTSLQLPHTAGEARKILTNMMTEMAKINEFIDNILKIIEELKLTIQKKFQAKTENVIINTKSQLSVVI